MCALKVGCDNPCRCVTDGWEGSKLHRGTFQMRWWVFTTKRAVDLSSVVSGHTSWHTTSLQKKWPEVKRFLHPRVYSQPDEVTPAKHPHKWEPQTVQIEIFVPVQMPGSQDNDASQGFPHSSPTYWQPSFSSCSLEPVTVHFVVVTGRWRNSWPCIVVVGKKCLQLKKKRKNQEGWSTPDLRCDVCRRMMGSVLLKVPWNLVSPPLVWVTETWVQSECMVRIPRNPVATVLKYESARPFFFPSLFFLFLLQTLISAPPLDPCSEAQQPLPRSFARFILFSFKSPEHLSAPPNLELFFPFKDPL